MTQTIVGDGADVVRGHVLAALEPGMGPRRPVECQRAPWAGTDLDPACQVLRVAVTEPRREHYVDDVLLDGLGDVEGVDLSPRLEDGGLMDRFLSRRRAGRGFL